MTEFRLTARQEQAVASRAHALTVVAGAGTGKTEVVARRLERLLAQSPLEEFRVLAVSYTVRAADGLRDRLASRLGDLHRRVDADTIHGFALGVVRRHGTLIGLPLEPEVLSRDEDRRELLAAWLRRGGYRQPHDPAATFRELDLDRAQENETSRVDIWRRVLAEAGALDYQAMLERATELLSLRSVRRIYASLYKHVIVDEAQNLTKSQYRLLTSLVGSPVKKHIATMLVGDERQSIVGFAGADHTLMALFEHEYRAERIELDKNFRSAQRIDGVARRVAAALDLPLDARSTSLAARGELRLEEFESEAEEGAGVASWIEKQLSDGLPNDVVSPDESTSVGREQIAVLGRSAAALIPTREALDKLDIPHASASTPDAWVTSPPAQAIVELIGFKSAPDHFSTRRRLLRLCGKDGDEKWTEVSELFRQSADRDIAELAHLGTVATPAELIAALRELDIGDPDWLDDLQQIQDSWTSFIDRVPASSQSFAELKHHIARCQRGDPLDSGVRLLTVHKAQGHEFRSVAVVACNEGQFPDFRAKTPEAEEAERRTFYVAVSRPFRSLLVSRARTRRTRYGPRPTSPSRFLEWVRD